MVIDCKKLAEEVKADVKRRVETYTDVWGECPKLAVVTSGRDEAGKVYVNNKKKACEEVGIGFELVKTFDMCDAVRKVNALNCDEKVHAVIVQLPCFGTDKDDRVTEVIHEFKDVDGLCVENVGGLHCNDAMSFVPATANGVLKIIQSVDKPNSHKNVVIVGRSMLVGRPLAELLLQYDYTVTVCHSKTKNLAEHTKRADIVVMATGVPKMLTADMVKEGSIVIDVGINRDKNGKLCGDVDFENVSKVAGYITPVPGGVGLLTVACLLENVITAAENQKYLKKSVDTGNDMW